MPRKNETIQHAIPAKVRLMPISEDNCWNMFHFRNYGKMTKYVHCVFKNKEKYTIGFFKHSHIDRDEIEVKVARPGWTGHYSDFLTLKRDEIFFAYFEVDEINAILEDRRTFYKYDSLFDCVDIIGTNRTTYFDRIRSQGMDFSYEQPYNVYYHQPILKNKKLDLRKKYGDVLWLNFSIDELDDKLFADIQKMAIEKFGVIKSLYHSRKSPAPCKIVEEIPVELRDAKLNFSNRISFQIERDYRRKSPFIKMSAGDYHDSFLSNMHMKTIYMDITSVNKAEEALAEFQKYSKIIPKLNSPWLFH